MYFEHSLSLGIHIEVEQWLTILIHRMNTLPKGELSKKGSSREVTSMNSESFDKECPFERKIVPAESEREA